MTLITPLSTENPASAPMPIRKPHKLKAFSRTIVVLNAVKKGKNERKFTIQLNAVHEDKVEGKKATTKERKQFTLANRFTHDDVRMIVTLANMRWLKAI